MQVICFFYSKLVETLAQLRQRLTLYVAVKNIARLLHVVIQKNQAIKLLTALQAK
ncbi:hypothetical protein RP300_01368 [Oligella urethralis]|nr:hypothetical protein RP300_01368 [Oligella urethralis]SUA60350.1 Uncharacterised protein [Oligella urethralis]